MNYIEGSKGLAGDPEFAAFVRATFDVDPEDGVVYRRVGKEREVKKLVRGTRHPQGHLVVSVSFHKRVRFIAYHKLVWFLVTGETPKRVHVHDGNYMNTRFANLFTVPEEKITPEQALAMDIKRQVTIDLKILAHEWRQKYVLIPFDTFVKWRWRQAEKPMHLQALYEFMNERKALYYFVDEPAETREAQLEGLVRQYKKKDHGVSFLEWAHTKMSLVGPAVGGLEVTMAVIEDYVKDKPELQPKKWEAAPVPAAKQHSLHEQSPAASTVSTDEYYGLSGEDARAGWLANAEPVLEWLAARETALKSDVVQPPAAKQLRDHPREPLATQVPAAQQHTDSVVEAPAVPTNESLAPASRSVMDISPEEADDLVSKFFAG